MRAWGKWARGGPTTSRFRKQWVPVRPGTDTALMLAIAYVLEEQKIADYEFLSSHCVGYERFRQYLLGLSDGIPKTPSWAAKICSVTENEIVDLANKK